MPGRVRGSLHQRMVVVPHRPYLRLTLTLGVVALVITTAAIAYWFGSGPGQFDVASAEREIQTQQALIRRYQSEIDELRYQQTSLQSARVLDEQTNQQVQLTLSALRERIAELERDVALYRSVMNLSATEPQVSLFSWSLVPTELPDYVAYEFVLAAAGNQGEPMVVTAEVDVMYGDDSMRQVSMLAAEDIEIRYVQKLAGVWQLPDGETPTKLNVNIAGELQTLAWPDKED